MNHFGKEKIYIKKVKIVPIKERLSLSAPIKRIGVPDDISRLTKFLASDKASYITGQTFHVNGGMFM